MQKARLEIISLRAQARVAHTVSLSAFQGNTQNFQRASYYWPKVSNSRRPFQLGSVQWDRLFDMLIQILLLHQDRG